MLSKTLQLSSMKASGLWLATMILVSPAKMTHLDESFMVQGKSFMYIIYMYMPSPSQVSKLRNLWKSFHVLNFVK